MALLHLLQKGMLLEQLYQGYQRMGIYTSTKKQRTNERQVKTAHAQTTSRKEQANNYFPVTKPPLLPYELVSYHQQLPFHQTPALPLHPE